LRDFRHMTFVSSLLAATAGAIVIALALSPLAAQQRKAPAKAVRSVEAVADIAALPERVQAMRQAIIEAARSGDVENLVPVLQSNELMPMLADKRVEDPAAFLREASVDGTGRDILAALIAVLEAGCVKLGIGGTDTYVWPYFAEVPLDGLTPGQQVELYRTAPPDTVKDMLETKTYTWYSLGIGPDGTWHYFLKSR
jgi:hypothetical protein